MDVIGLYKNDIKNVVAKFRYCITPRQISVLCQFNKIIICFDGDESGYKAALRAAENSIAENLNLKKKYYFYR